jgi:hypothetical protein
VNIAHYEGDCFLDLAILIRAGFSTKAIDSELAPARGKVRGRDLNWVDSHSLIIAAER